MHEKEFKTMMVTPEGSIIRMIPSGKKPKPETIPIGSSARLSAKPSACVSVIECVRY